MARREMTTDQGSGLQISFLAPRMACDLVWNGAVREESGVDREAKNEN